MLTSSSGLTMAQRPQHSRRCFHSSVASLTTAAGGKRRAKGINGRGSKRADAEGPSRSGEAVRGGEAGRMVASDGGRETLRA
jgi:hypothetical protein